MSDKARNDGAAETISTAWKLLTALLALVAITALALAVVALRRSPAQPSDHLVLVDDEGRPRIRMSSRGEQAAIEILDPDGTTRAALVQAGEEVGLRLHARGHEQPLVDLAVTGNANGRVVVRNSSTGFAQLGALPGGELILGASDTSRAVIAASTESAEVRLQHQGQTGSILLDETGGRFILSKADSEIRLQRTSESSDLTLQHNRQPGTRFLAVAKGPDALIYATRVVEREDESP